MGRSRILFGSGAFGGTPRAQNAARWNGIAFNMLF
jgi:hypothetical protein